MIALTDEEMRMLIDRSRVRGVAEVDLEWLESMLDSLQRIRGSRYQGGVAKVLESNPHLKALYFDNLAHRSEVVHAVLIAFLAFDHESFDRDLKRAMSMAKMVGIESVILHAMVRRLIELSPLPFDAEDVPDLGKKAADR